MEMFPSPERIALLRKVSPAHRLRIQSKCGHAARQIISEPIRAKYPEKTEAETYKGVTLRWTLVTDEDHDAIQDEIERRGWMETWLLEAAKLTELGI